MAKPRGGGKAKAEKSAKAAAEEDPIAGPVALFASGDYARAKKALAAAAKNESLGEHDRTRARELLDTLKPERGALWVGLGCIALMLLVVTATVLTQP
jgi:hypothetical protein